MFASGLVDSNMATLSRTSGKVGGMLVKPPLPAVQNVMSRIPASRSSDLQAEVAKTSGLKMSRSFDSDLQVPQPTSMSPSMSNLSRSSVSRSLSMEEGLNSILMDGMPAAPAKSGNTASPPTDLKLLKTQAKQCVRAGELIPDNVMGALLKERLSKLDCGRHGWLMDGFPRTPEQVDILAENNGLPDIAIVMNVKDEDLVERLVNRRIDPVTKQIYNLKYSKPETEEVAERLVTREDDKEDVIRSRLNTYRTNLPGILANFSHYDIPVIEVDASAGVSREEVYRRIRRAIIQGRDQIMEEKQDFGRGESAPLNLAIAGPPGCGKGSQAELLRRDLGCVHISSGDLIREVIRD